MNENPVLSMEIKQASGWQLDAIGEFVGLERGTRFIFFKESDKNFRPRVKTALQARYAKLRYDVKID